MEGRPCGFAKASKNKQPKGRPRGEGLRLRQGRKAATARSGPNWGFAPAPKGRKTGEAEENADLGQEWPKTSRPACAPFGRGGPCYALRGTYAPLCSRGLRPPAGGGLSSGWECGWGFAEARRKGLFDLGRVKGPKKDRTRPRPKIGLFPAKAFLRACARPRRL